MSKGILYGVSVGPGDPGLLTFKAAETIRLAPVVAAPRTRDGTMVALDIARGAVDLADKEILPLDFAMSPDPDARARLHETAAGLLRTHLDAGRTVAMLNLGDVSVYASFRYVADILTAQGYEIRMIPGVTSFSAAAARLGVSLTDMRKPLYIIPDGGSMDETLIDHAAGFVFMKSAGNLSALLDLLDRRGLLEQASVVQNCGMATERVFPSAAGANIAPEYFTVVLLKKEGEK